jgi:hypothetical protein
MRRWLGAAAAALSALLAAAGTPAQTAPLPSDADARIDAQDAPHPTQNGARFGCSSADGRSTLALRALVQADAAHCVQDTAGALDQDFRRGSGDAAARRADRPVAAGLGAAHAVRIPVRRRAPAAGTARGHQGAAPVATGAPGSAHHSLQEPG